MTSKPSQYLETVREEACILDLDEDARILYKNSHQACPTKEACLGCGALCLPRQSSLGTCPECQQKLHVALYTHRRQGVPGLVDFGPSMYGTSGGNQQNELPIELLENAIYVGGRLTQLQQKHVTRIIHLMDGQDDPTVCQAASRMFDYRAMTYRDSVFDVYEQMVEVVKFQTVTALYGVHPHAGWQKGKGVIVLLAFLMSFAGLSMHASKELLREKGIIGPEEYGGDTSKRVDDLADLFASMQAS